MERALRGSMVSVGTARRRADPKFQEGDRGSFFRRPSAVDRGPNRAHAPAKLSMGGGFLHQRPAFNQGVQIGSHPLPVSRITPGARKKLFSLCYCPTELRLPNRGCRGVTHRAPDQRDTLGSERRSKDEAWEFDCRLVSPLSAGLSAYNDLDFQPAGRPS